jgi:hypothetical protein
MNPQSNLFSRRRALAQRNLHLARRRWGAMLSRVSEVALRCHSERLGMSIERGDLILLGGNWYVTHSGLLRLANRRGCSGIDVVAASEFCDAAAARWAFKATVYKSSKCKGFVGYGDADPSNTSSVVRGAEMLVAETRAGNRALRKAYGIGICSVEELGSFSGPLTPAAQSKKPVVQPEPANGNGHHPLRDRLRLLIRQHQLDPSLVKLYAADFCGTQELRQASRELVEGFIQHLTQYAAHDHDGLVCELNSFAPKPVSPSPDLSGDGPNAVGVA